MKTKLFIAFIGNIIDTIATLILLETGYFVEINPVMAWLLQWPALAAIAKVVAVTSVLIYAYLNRETKYIDELATFAATLYGGLGIYYIIIFILLY